MATVLQPQGIYKQAERGKVIELPSPTAWPFVLALGFALLFAGLLTSASVSALGLVLTVAGCVGWFREVFPHEHEEVVPLVPEEVSLTTERHSVERIPLAEELVRAWLPIETYPVSAGVKGGLAGGVAMAVLACTYGLLKTGSIWYPINLLAATVYAKSFSVEPGHLNSFLEKHIDWWWFAASQAAFGIVAGIVVMRYSPVRTHENLPFAVRAGIAAPGIIPPRANGEKRP